MTNSQIKAVIFDFGGVFLDDPLPGMLKYYSSQLGVNTEEMKKAFLKEIDPYQKGEIEEVEFWKRVAKDLNVKPPEKSIWLNGIKDNYQEKDATLKIVDKLKSNGYKLGLISNTETPVVDLIKNTCKGFDSIILSCEVGLAKPGKEIFELSLEKLGARPQEAIFIDDRIENVNTANEMGMKGILFTTPEKLTKQLDELLI